MQMELRCRSYRPEDQANLGEFDCCAKADDPQEYEIEINDWIKDPAAIAQDKASGAAEGIYVYEITENDQTRIIAYGVLAREPWSLATGPATVEETQVSMIAMLGLHRDFQGKKVGEAGSDNYSTVIFQDILARAAKRCGPKRAIGLYVHPDNKKAIIFYKRNGFHELTYIQWPSPRFRKTYSGMVLYLPEDV